MSRHAAEKDGPTPPTTALSYVLEELCSALGLSLALVKYYRCDGTMAEVQVSLERAPAENTACVSHPLGARGEHGTLVVSASREDFPCDHEKLLLALAASRATVALQEWRLLRHERAASELARVSRLLSLGVLTASVTHEVCQPLSGIVTNATACSRMLAACPPNIHGAQESARRILRDGNRASEIVTRLRSLFANKGDRTDSVDLNEAAAEVAALASRKLQECRVALRLECAEDVPFITGDRVQLQQVILNLLINAAESMSDVDDRERVIVIKTTRQDDGVQLSVKDVGVGLGSSDAERLFEAFYSTKSSGMGIGLSVSRSIVESHAGRIWAEPNLGPGATFSFALPSGSVR